MFVLQHHREGIQFLYNGQYGIVTDSNGLYQMRSRYYNVDIKRFINQDVLLGSILDSQTMNRYSYVQGNPLNAMDPFGLCAANIFTKEFGHGVLDLLGFIPIIGDVADIANAFWYFSDHQYAEGFASIISALPGIGSFLGNGLKLTFKCSKYAIKTAGYIETGCKILANIYTLGESSYYAVESGKKIYNTIQSGGTVDWRDGLGLAISIVTAVISGKGLASGIKEMNYVRTTEPVVCCFTAGTAILTSDVNGDAAEKPIEDIQVGDLVYSTNPETNESDYKEVQQVFVSKTDVLVHIEVNGEDIQATVTHPFLVDGQWIAAKDLMAGDLLTLADGTKAAIEKIWYEKLTAPVLVYNFEVADFHTYYVGNSKVLVHNTCNKTGNTEEVGLGGNQSVVKGESGGLSNEVDLHRPYIRKDVRAQVEANALKDTDGHFIDPNTFEVIEGKYDLGHKTGNEFRSEKAMAQREGLTQKQFNDRMNNPDYYQIESPSSNRSRIFEKK